MCRMRGYAFMAVPPHFRSLELYCAGSINMNPAGIPSTPGLIPLTFQDASNHELSFIFSFPELDSRYIDTGMEPWRRLQ